jgi:trehalose-phosphatase
VALDYDGTLTEIVDDPAAPDLTEESCALLARIPAADRRLAIVSGRALDDVRHRVGIADAVLIRNHARSRDCKPSILFLTGGRALGN